MNPDKAAQAVAESEAKAVAEMRRQLRDLKRQKDSVDLKPRINQFLWAVLPGQVTIGDADDLACAVYDLILTAVERADLKKPV